MNKLTYSDITHQQLVDVRPQLDYQSGHIKQSLNLNPKNFKKYADHLLSKNESLILIGNDERELEDVEALAKDMGFALVEGYITIEDVSPEKLETSHTVSA